MPSLLWHPATQHMAARRSSFCPLELCDLELVTSPLWAWVSPLTNGSNNSSTYPIGSRGLSESTSVNTQEDELGHIHRNVKPLTQQFHVQETMSPKCSLMCTTFTYKNAWRGMVQNTKQQQTTWMIDRTVIQRELHPIPGKPRLSLKRIRDICYEPASEEVKDTLWHEKDKGHSSGDRGNPSCENMNPPTNLHACYMHRWR